MSSISVYELKKYLEDVPDDYEVIMEIKTKYVIEPGESIAYINGIKKDVERREMRLMN